MRMKRVEQRERIKKKKGHANKIRVPVYQGDGHDGSCGTLHFTRRWDPHQPVSSGFTAMTLW